MTADSYPQEFAEPDAVPPPEQSPTFCWTHGVDEADEIEGESNDD